MFELQDAILVVLAVFMLIGAFDKVLGNRYGYGEAFERGFSTIGPIAIVMIGMISLAPVLADVLRPLVVPAYQWLGADPAMFATTLLALDMGGYALAGELAETEESARFAGILLGTMLGPTLTFTIPIALSILRKEDHPIFAKGILIGIATIPLGLLAGGMVAGFSIVQMAANIVPILLFSSLIILGLWWKTKRMVQGFQQFGKGVAGFTTIATAVVVFEVLTGWTVVPGMAPSEEGIVTVGLVAFTLAGAFPLVHFVQKHWRKSSIGERFFMNDTAISGWLASLAHVIPMFALNEMKEEGKLMNYAFAVSGAFILGGHLAFTAAVDRDMIVPMLVGKFTGGITAMFAAFWVIKKSR
ncbi:ethanolamine utilization protein EutH [Salibacterium salarium]|uniref:Ethanolamine utilization protein EutH n=1 Tax=Salibacterium salarium TaxID=284579 RepID=A0A428MSF4_9BACI|nr:ethanolamine utilization protein EutH [Salibacterium salarium]RSL29087.1 ethanolamine utilization protein EutH [Salibacterium salarium]